MIKVLAFGSFDLLHPGHIFFLENAKKLGDYLIVCLTRDKIYQLQKKQPPIFNQYQRKKIIQSIKFVDEVILGDLDINKINSYNIIRKIKPDIVVLGYDQKLNKNTFKKISKLLNKNIKIVHIKAYNNKKFSSSKYKNFLKK